ncbi:hypothetical protein Pmar_PMAR004217 [Perkinsus marinus ATCC 50983]|uniref:Uncharacterized protein n=1 Tax=Perkinsus marinus (strain ATCC 50983 / TXsc) TaxID=423536 RepID=C5LPM4_PERM5|nr:hypothetical protein Pmar_PMAR004217 [Perkinsus marinus ATCC 50983]EER01344.1 hypothetical protein Pmar_PMAR004217 [Perkinsus marinus ATCC 50983]|eukprot:XP_002768626.1 hypothetical protein Pmar_PMAR004217 [Perkinsus marinus ATCC 50983]
MVFPLVGALINGATATLNVASGTFGAWAALHSDQHQAEIAQDIQGHSVRLQRSMALREDIRDLRKLEVCVSKFARALLLEEYRIYLPSENEIRNAGGPSLWDRVKALQTLPTEGKDVDDAMIDSKEFYAETQININEHFKEQINRYIPLKEFSDKYLRAGGTALIASVYAVCVCGASTVLGNSDSILSRTGGRFNTTEL